MLDFAVAARDSTLLQESGLVVVDDGWRIASLCTHCEAAFGVSSTVMAERPVTDLLPDFPSDAVALAAPPGAIVPFFRRRKLTARRADGSALCLVADAFLDRSGVVSRVIVVVVMQTSSPPPVDSVGLLQAIEQTADSVMITTLDGTISYVNPSFERLTGYARSEAIGTTPALVASGLHTPDFFRHLWKTILAGEVFQGVLVNRRRNGELIHEEQTITPIRNAEGRIESFVSTAKDVTDRVRSEERLRVLTNMDTLTGLPNRNLFNDRLQQAVARARRHGFRGALLLVDLDRFKAINDAHGHEAGDFVMMRLAQRLRSAVQDDDTVARIGGDEFAIVIEAMAGNDDAVNLARSILALCRQPIDDAQHRHFVSCSVGISVFPDQGEDVSTLLRNADIAMYQAKSAGRDCVRAFSQPMAEMVNGRSKMETLLRDAIARGEFSLAYQPQVDLSTGRLAGLEALLRWSSPTLGDVPPLEFIPLLEESGQIANVGAWVVREAIREIQAIGNRDPGTRLTINISPRQFQDAGFMAVAREAMRLAREPRVELEFEITESAVMDDIDQAIDTIRQVAALGIRFAIDDFGTGYSSLAYLQRFPLHVLKIDRSFIANCVQGETSMAIVHAIVRLSRTLGLATVAEGVETADQLRALRAAGCDMAQGWLLRAPSRAAEAIKAVVLP